MLMNKIGAIARDLIEKYSFGVCNFIADKMGIQVSRVRIYFIYLAFVTFGSAMIVYFFIGFWLNVQKYYRDGMNYLKY